MMLVALDIFVVLSVCLGPAIAVAFFVFYTGADFGYWACRFSMGILLSTSFLIPFSDSVFGAPLIVRISMRSGDYPDYILTFTGVSVCFVILTALLIAVSVLVSWTNVLYRLREFYIILFVIEFCLFQLFLVDDIFLFYFFYESIVIPVFFLILIWGSRERKAVAAFQFFVFTFLGSILMLAAIFVLYSELGSTDMTVLREKAVLLRGDVGRYVWLALFLAFMVKTPMVPVHSWLPEAHVEAPTAGSVLLAGILLKMGLYGMYKFLVLLLPAASHFFFPLVVILGVFSIVYISSIILVQTDLKKIVAYASIAHMNFAAIGLFSGSLEGVVGSLYLLLMHGIVSSGLFICVGILYDRYHTRQLYYYGGLTATMPIFCGFLLLFVLANFALPLTGSFVAEFLVFVGVADASGMAVFLISCNIIFSAGYSIWLFGRLAYGPIRPYVPQYSDLNRREFIILSGLAFLTVAGGVFPGPILSLLIP